MPPQLSLWTPALLLGAIVVGILWLMLRADLEEGPPPAAVGLEAQRITSQASVPPPALLPELPSETTPPQPPGELAITGVVLGLDGQPLADAMVSLHWVNPVDHDDQHNRGIRSGADGTFVIEAPGPGVCRLGAMKDWASARRQECVAGARDVVLRITLRWSTLQGRVVDPAGEPIAGAMVLLSPSGGSGGSGKPSGADGTFEFRVREPGVRDLRASLAGYLASEALSVDLEGGEQREGVVLQLRRGESLEGQVRDTEGRPVGGAVVRVATDAFERFDAFTQGNSLGDSFGDSKVPPVLSDEEGVFRVDGLPSGMRCALFAFREGFCPPAEVGFTARHGSGDRGIELLLHRVAALAGTVLGPTGEGVAGVQVHLDHLERPRRSGPQNDADSFGANHEVLTGAQGHFRFENLLPGPHRLRVVAERYIPPPRQEILLGEGERLGGLEVRLDAAVAITGRVLDTLGEPIPQARVEVSNYEADPGRRLRVKADEEGRFEVADARPGVLYQAWAKAAGFCLRAGDLEGTPAPAGGTVDLVLERACSIEGVVRAADGGVLSSIGISPVTASGSSRGGMRGSGRESSERAFLLEQIEPELVAVRVSAEGYVSREVPAQFAPGEWHLDVGTIEVSSEGLWLSGSVRSSAGVPLEGARVYLDGFSFPNTRTPKSGEYALGPLVGGRHWVVVRHGEHPPLRTLVHLESGPTPRALDLQLQPGGSLGGELRRADGSPASSRMVYVRPSDPDRAIQWAHSDREGSYRMVLAPGRHHVSVIHWQRGHRQILVPEQEIEIEAGASLVLDLVTPR